MVATILSLMALLLEFSSPDYLFSTLPHLNMLGNEVCRILPMTWILHAFCIYHRRSVHIGLFPLF